MSAANFQACLAFTLQAEGGWTDDPRDPGGATNQGITIGTFRHYYGADATISDLRGLTDAQRDAIYRAGYWNAVAGDQLPPGLDLMVFDFGVNVGPLRSAEIMQQALGVDVDGSIGPQSLGAANAADLTALLPQLDAAHEAYYRSLADFPTFGAGWINRCRQRVALALSMLPGG